MASETSRISRSGRESDEREPPGVDARRKILDASIELVAEQGVRAVSFREVARRAGVSHQTPYHHFGDHIGILREIAREGFGHLAAAMNDAAAKTNDPKKALTDAGIAYVRFARSHVGHFRVMFQTTMLQEHAPSGSSSEAGPLPEAQHTYETLMRFAAAAHKAGAGRGLSVETIGHLAWSTVHGLSLLIIEGALPAKQKPYAKKRSGEDIEAATIRHLVSALSRLLDDA